jgi:hypothetical protein
MSLTPAEPGHLPPSTLVERSRELRQRGVLLRWRAQRLRRKSQQLLAEARHLRQRLPCASIEDTAALYPVWRRRGAQRGDLYGAAQQKQFPASGA